MINKKLLSHFLRLQIVKYNFENYFTWKSNLKAPIYVDNRLIFSYPDLRKTVITGLAKLISKQYDKIDGIFGTATAGIAPAILLSEKLKLPCGYVRLQAKPHGKKQLIEGYYQPGWRVIVVEDTISTGNSVLAVIDILKSAGIEVVAVVAIFTYGIITTEKKLLQKKVNCHSLITLQDLLKYEQQIIKLDKNKLISFLQTLNEMEMRLSHE